jgi:glycosyltransferase involved in cell wall biosynthesis
MPFLFIKYIQPTWYFNLKPIKGKIPYWIDYRKLPPSLKPLIQFDPNYKTEDARLVDASFQAWHKGIINSDPSLDLIISQQPIHATIEDNYRFIRKYFNKIWVYYCLILRLLSLNNPFREIKAFKNTKDVKKIDLYSTFNEDVSYRNFKSQLLESTPFISVIIPTLNRYKYLKDVFLDLLNQDYKNFEVIVVDQTDDPDKSFYNNFKLNQKIIFQQGKGQWLARNEAIRMAKGDFLLFYDDDSRVASNWISEHIKALDYFQADISAGVSFSKIGGEIPRNYSFFRWADQFDSGNALVKREVFKKIGLFDRQFDKMRMGDGEFGLRAYLNGFKSISHPHASRLHLKVDSGGLRQMGSWDAFRTKQLFSPKPIPSVLYYYRTYFPGSYVNNALFLGVLPSLVPYKFKNNKAIYPFGILIGILFLPVLAIQVFKSWNQSGKMIKEGNKIEFIP